MASPSLAGNTLDTARNLGILKNSQSFQATDAVSVNDVGDYYRFTLLGRSSLNLSILPSEGNAQVVLLSDSGQSLAASSNGGGMAQLINTQLEAGTYYIQVSSDALSVSNYALNLSSQDAANTGLLWRNQITGEVSPWLMNGPTPISASNLGVVDLNWQVGGASDFNQDGNGDLVWRNQLLQVNSVWLTNSADASLIKAAVLSTINDVNWQVVTAGDFNGDMKADLFWRNRGTGENSIWFMNGTGQISIAPVVTIADLNWQIAGSGDFNRDGKVDLIWRNRATGDNSVWLMDGSKPIDAQNIHPVSDSNWSLQAIGDFNGNGVADFVWRSRLTGEVSCWLWDYSNGKSVGDRVVGIATVKNQDWQIEAAPMRFSAPTAIDGVGNTLGQAFTIGTLTGTAIYGHWINSSTNPNDYYQFTLAGTSTVSLTLNGLSASGHLQLLNSEGTVLNMSSSGPQDDTISQILGAGTYYARILATPGDNTTYRLSLQQTTNTPPVVTSFGKTLLSDKSLVFSSIDFSNQFNDANGDSLTQVKITQLPTSGKLTLNGVEITQVQTTIAATNLSQLVYIPNQYYFGSDSFGWTGFDGQNFAFQPASVDLTVTPWDHAPTLIVSPGTTTYTASQPAEVIDPNLQIFDPDTLAQFRLLDAAQVTIIKNFNPIEDRLGIQGQEGSSGIYTTSRNAQISWDYDGGNGILTLKNLASVDDYEEILKLVTYRNSVADPMTPARTFSFALTNQPFLQNNHFYEYVPALDISWTDARDAAAQRSFYGLQGYLATITSQAENDFIIQKLAPFVGAWFGGSDVDQKGTWKWMTGPEAGTVFWQGGPVVEGGQVVNGQYNHWGSLSQGAGDNEPNNLDTEFYTQTTVAGFWNNLPNVSPLKIGLYSIQGYIVEYGSMAGDPIVKLSDIKEMNLLSGN